MVDRFSRSLCVLSSPRLSRSRVRRLAAGCPDGAVGLVGRVCNRRADDRFSRAGVGCFVGRRWRCFGITVVKVFMWDMAGLDEIYRIVAFFVLAVLLAAAAWVYQRVQPSQEYEAP